MGIDGKDPLALEASIMYPLCEPVSVIRGEVIWRPDARSVQIMATGHSSPQSWNCPAISLFAATPTLPQGSGCPLMLHADTSVILRGRRSGVSAPNFLATLITVVPPTEA